MPKPIEYSRFDSPVNHSAVLKVNNHRNAWHSCLFPTVCALCDGDGQPGRELCSGCERDLPLVTVSCRQCGAPLSLTGYCGSCQQHPPAFTRTVVTYHYLPPVDSLLKQLKFGGNLQLARLLGGLMADRIVRESVALPEVIIPVPLHVSRLRQRGFNQALELARPIAARLMVPLDWRHVVRTRATDAQSDLPAVLRARNVKGAFSVSRGFTASRVAVVDDVMTTGHTVNELALTLRRAGVSDISVWACARAVFGR